MATPEQIAAFYEAYNRALKQASDIVNQRAKDYKGQTIGVQDCFPGAHPHRDACYLQMLHVKLTRCRSIQEQHLAVGDEWDADPALWAAQRQRFVHSLFDLINYAAFWLADITMEGERPQ